MQLIKIQFKETQSFTDQIGILELFSSIIEDVQQLREENTKYVADLKSSQNLVATLTNDLEMYASEKGNFQDKVMQISALLINTKKNEIRRLQAILSAHNIPFHGEEDAICEENDSEKDTEVHREVSKGYYFFCFLNILLE